MQAVFNLTGEPDQNPQSRTGCRLRPAPERPLQTTIRTAFCDSKPPDIRPPSDEIIRLRTDVFVTNPAGQPVARLVKSTLIPGPMVELRETFLT